MKEFRFNIKKNKWLKTERDIDFDDVIDVLKKEKLIKVIDHPNKKRYPKQRIFLIEINKYIYIAPPL
ncbi:MAG: PF04365 family protein [Candidatus Roizmanbacteria bacterium GW2011_GWA2_35_8]|uniref:PF04365 family protein n=1 Tax=Candidatus Roizmanbacteria bacterium GW2011_GWA2_35_8 TaxID=1618479 RepID=A0A0G0D179_9BACT|nr:MAG: PF04365 family protein [Candidatus Roizmanbacteria bacterium GW2011_GWA2_35_8]